MWAPNIPGWAMLEFGCGLARMLLVTVEPACGAEELWSEGGWSEL